MGKFGWSLPPGCGRLPGEEPTGPCLCCGLNPDSDQRGDACICPECPVCSSVGDPKCYREHGLKYSMLQLVYLHNTSELMRIEAAAEREFWKNYDLNKEEW